MEEERYQASSFALGPVFMYEKKGDSAVIRRCFSHEECVVIPEQICGLPVTEVGPYCFSAHMDEKAFRKEFEAGKLQIFQDGTGFLPAGGQEKGKPAREAEPNKFRGAITGLSELRQGEEELANGEEPDKSGEEIFGSSELRQGEGELASGAEPDKSRGMVFGSSELRQREEKTSSEAERDKSRETIFGPLTEKGIQTPAGLIPSLSGNNLKELVLPGSVRRVGRYCLYNCGALEQLEFDSALSDWGSGVFTGCHHIRKIRLYLGEDGKSSLKQMLDEVPEAVEVEFLSRNPGQAESTVGNLTGPSLMARLIFPEFYEEGVENTPARILETHVHGSGILYRNCFQSRAFDFQQYDRLLPYAVAREDFETTARLVTGRLWFPYELSEAARLQYEEYVISERAQFAELFVRTHDMRGIRWLTETAAKIYPDLYDLLTELAGRAGFVEAIGFLMENRRMSKKNKGRGIRKRLELSDFSEAAQHLDKRTVSEKEKMLGERCFSKKEETGFSRKEPVSLPGQESVRREQEIREEDPKRTKTALPAEKNRSAARRRRFEL